MKSLKDIALNITEEEYRNDGFMHYSTLATYERGGFNCLETLFEKKESPSLVFGSAVDAIITGGYQEFNNKFMIAEFPVLSDNMLKIVNALFESYSTVYSSLEEIPTSILSSYWIKFDGRKWKAETQAATIIKEGNEYYRLKYIAGDKIPRDFRAKLGLSFKGAIAYKYENLTLSTTLGLFTPYQGKGFDLKEKFDESHGEGAWDAQADADKYFQYSNNNRQFGHFDVDWDVAISYQFLKVLNVSLSTNMKYYPGVLIADKNGDLKERVQFKSVLGLGIGYSF